MRGAGNWGWVWERMIDEYCRAHGVEWLQAAQCREELFDKCYEFVRQYFQPQPSFHLFDVSACKYVHLVTIWNGENLSNCAIRGHYLHDELN